MTLKYEDSLRTMKGAQARVRFPSKEVVQINENSYVVLKPEKVLQEIQLLQGDIRASRAKVIMPGGTVVKPQGASDYQARVRDDETEVVFVYKGQVDVTAQGKTVTVKEGFGTQVPKSAAPMAPMPLPSFKDFDPAEMTTGNPSRAKVPEGAGVIRFTPPTVPTDKNDGQKAKSVVSKGIMVNYHVQLSREASFGQVVLDKTEPTARPFDIKKEKIPDGRYFMRVAFMDALGVQGPYSAPSTIVKDTEAPAIQDVVPANGQRFEGEEAYCDVTGVVKGAAMVAVNGEVVFVSPTGQFNKFINLKEGTNKIVVMARDVNGNETVLERAVTYNRK
jgi:hypothetical protein